MARKTTAAFASSTLHHAVRERRLRDGVRSEFARRVDQLAELLAAEVEARAGARGPTSSVRKKDVGEAYHELLHAQNLTRDVRSALEQALDQVAESERRSARARVRR